MLTAEEQVLLICARPSLSNEQAQRLRTLVDNGLDWQVLVNGAVQNLIVPLFAQNIFSLGRQSIPDEASKFIEVVRTRTVIRMMHILALKKDLVERFLKPRGIEYVELKGEPIGKLLYGNRFVRQYRDIDLLVSRDRILELATRLVSEGWSVINKEWAPDRGRDLDVLSEFQAAIELRHASGVVLELHRTLDNSGCVFDASQILRSSLSGEEGKVLPIDRHIAYLCFHHSRHRWESLHWCADASAMSRLSPKLLMAAKDYARSRGIESTIGETLKLAANLEAICLTGEPPREAQSRFLKDTLDALAHSVHPEVNLYRSADHDEEKQPDFSYPWQRTPTYELKFAISRLKPNLNDHDWYPVSRGLRWIYWLTRPIRVTTKIFKRYAVSQRAR